MGKVLNETRDKVIEVLIAAGFIADRCKKTEIPYGHPYSTNLAKDSEDFFIFSADSLQALSLMLHYEDSFKHVTLTEMLNDFHKILGYGMEILIEARSNQPIINAIMEIQPDFSKDNLREVMGHILKHSNASKELRTSFEKFRKDRSDNLQILNEANNSQNQSGFDKKFYCFYKLYEAQIEDEKEHSATFDINAIMHNVKNSYQNLLKAKAQPSKSTTREERQRKKDERQKIIGEKESVNDTIKNFYDLRTQQQQISRTNSKDSGDHSVTQDEKISRFKRASQLILNLGSLKTKVAAELGDDDSDDKKSIRTSRGSFDTSNHDNSPKSSERKKYQDIGTQTTQLEFELQIIEVPKQQSIREQKKEKNNSDIETQSYSGIVLTKPSPEKQAEKQGCVVS